MIELVIRIAIAMVLAFATPARAVPSEQCPALDAERNPEPLALPARKSATSSSEDALAIPAAAKAIAEGAAEIVARYEGGGGNPWGYVSAQEVLSVGFMQWNWKTGSLVGTFLAAIPKAEIDAAPVAIVDGLIALKKSAMDKSPGAQARAAAVIANWITARETDPLVVSGQRKSVAAALREWLSRPNVKIVQMSLVDREMRTAYALSKRWLADQGNDPDDIGVRLLASFFDLITFNRGRSGLWLEHVRQYRQGFQSKAHIIESVSKWLEYCTKFVSPTTVRLKRMYGLSDAKASVSLWRAAIAENPDQFTDQQVDIFIVGYLCARRSTGSDPPRGFRGIYQADVMNRRGMLAIGIGSVHGLTQTVDPLK